MNQKPTTTMSNSGAKALAIGGLILIAAIATFPVGGAILGSTLMLGSIALDPIVWAVAGAGSMGILLKKEN